MSTIRRGLKSMQCRRERELVWLRVRLMGHGVGGTGVSIVVFFLTADGGRQNKHCKECQKGHCLFHCQDVFLTLFRTPLSNNKRSVVPYTLLRIEVVGMTL